MQFTWLLSEVWALFRACGWKLFFIVFLFIVPKLTYIWLVYFDVVPDVYVLSRQLWGTMPDFRDSGVVSLLIYLQKTGLVSQSITTILFGFFDAVAIVLVTRTAVVWQEGNHGRRFEGARRILAPSLFVWFYLVVSTVMLNLAAFLFIVPWLFLSVVWFVSAFAAADQTLWPQRAMARSWNLTRGARWQILSLIGIGIATSFIIGVLRGAMTAFLASELDLGVEVAIATNRAFTSIMMVSRTYVAALFGVATYLVLLNAEQGVTKRTIAGVFD